MKILVAAAFMLCSIPAFAAELWGGAQSGMTIEQVRALYPAAVRPDEPGTFANGARTELALPGPELAGQPFTAEFAFRDGRLHHVRLAMTSVLSYAQATSVIISIRQSLVAKYGPPFEWVEKPGQLMSNADGTWRSSGVLVHFTALGVGENPAVIQILYNEPSDASKL